MFGGAGYGAWPCIANRLHQDSVVYSVGVGFDTAFDQALMAQFGLVIHGFDPTPRVIEWLQQNPQPRLLSFIRWDSRGWMENYLLLPQPRKCGFWNGCACCCGGSRDRSCAGVEVVYHHVGTGARALGCFKDGH